MFWMHYLHFHLLFLSYRVDLFDLIYDVICFQYKQTSSQVCFCLKLSDFTLFFSLIIVIATFLWHLSY